MNARVRRSASGFTLIEMAIVMLISGMIIAAGFQAYKLYSKNRFASDAYEKQERISGSISTYRTSTGRLPCPADPTAPLSSLNAGREISAASCNTLRLATTAAGTCIQGVCKALGRDTSADVDTAGDPVLIGAIPFADIKANSGVGMTKLDKDLTYRDVLDPWGYQMSYIVSGYLTDVNPAVNQPSYGAVYVKTPNIPPTTPIDLIQPPGSAYYALVSHGDNHKGAYSAEGTRPFLCTAGTADVSNCDGSGVVSVGIRTLQTGTSYFDDVIYQESSAIRTLWNTTPAGALYNVNSGDVGIGVDDPQNKLEVMGNVLGVDIIQDKICETSGGVTQPCWSPKAFANSAGTQCTPSGTPGMINVMQGIVGDSAQPFGLRAVCQLVPMTLVGTNQACAPVIHPITFASIPTFAVGFNSTGAVVCEPAPGTGF